MGLTNIVEKYSEGDSREVEWRGQELRRNFQRVTQGRRNGMDNN